MDRMRDLVARADTVVARTLSNVNSDKGRAEVAATRRQDLHSSQTQGFLALQAKINEQHEKRQVVTSLSEKLRALKTEIEGFDDNLAEFEEEGIEVAAEISDIEARIATAMEEIANCEALLPVAFSKRDDIDRRRQALEAERRLVSEDYEHKKRLLNDVHTNMQAIMGNFAQGETNPAASASTKWSFEGSVVADPEPSTGPSQMSPKAQSMRRTGTLARIGTRARLIDKKARAQERWSLVFKAIRGGFFDGTGPVKYGDSFNVDVVHSDDETPADMSFTVGASFKRKSVAPVGLKRASTTMRTSITPNTTGVPAGGGAQKLVSLAGAGRAVVAAGRLNTSFKGGEDSSSDAVDAGILRSLNAELQLYKQRFEDAQTFYLAMRDRYSYLRIELVALRQIVAEYSGDTIEDLAAEIRFYQNERKELYDKLYYNKPYQLPPVHRVYGDPTRDAAPGTTDKLLTKIDRVRAQVEKQMRENAANPESAAFKTSVIERLRKEKHQLQQKVNAVKPKFATYRRKIEALEAARMLANDDLLSGAYDRDAVLLEMQEKAMKVQEHLLLTHEEDRHAWNQQVSAVKAELAARANAVLDLQEALNAAKETIASREAEKKQAADLNELLERQVNQLSSVVTAQDLGSVDNALHLVNIAKPSIVADIQTNGLGSLDPPVSAPLGGFLLDTYTTQYNQIQRLGELFKSMVCGSLRKNVAVESLIGSFATGLRDLQQAAKKMCSDAGAAFQEALAAHGGMGESMRGSVRRPGVDVSVQVSLAAADAICVGKTTQTLMSALATNYRDIGLMSRPQTFSVATDPIPSGVSSPDGASATGPMSADSAVRGGLGDAQLKAHIAAAKANEAAALAERLAARQELQDQLDMRSTLEEIRMQTQDMLAEARALRVSVTADLAAASALQGTVCVLLQDGDDDDDAVDTGDAAVVDDASVPAVPGLSRRYFRPNKTQTTEPWPPSVVESAPEATSDPQRQQLLGGELEAVAAGAVTHSEQQNAGHVKGAERRPSGPRTPPVGSSITAPAASSVPVTVETQTAQVPTVSTAAQADLLAYMMATPGGGITPLAPPLVPPVGGGVEGHVRSRHSSVDSSIVSYPITPEHVSTTAPPAAGPTTAAVDGQAVASTIGTPAAVPSLPPRRTSAPRHPPDPASSSPKISSVSGGAEHALHDPVEVADMGTMTDVPIAEGAATTDERAVQTGSIIIEVGTTASQTQEFADGPPRHRVACVAEAGCQCDEPLEYGTKTRVSSAALPLRLGPLLDSSFAAAAQQNAAETEQSSRGTPADPATPTQISQQTDPDQLGRPDDELNLHVQHTPLARPRSVPLPADEALFLPPDAAVAPPVPNGGRPPSAEPSGKIRFKKPSSAGSSRRGAKASTDAPAASEAGGEHLQWLEETVAELQQRLDSAMHELESAVETQKEADARLHEVTELKSTCDRLRDERDHWRHEHSKLENEIAGIQMDLGNDFGPGDANQKRGTGAGPRGAVGSRQQQRPRGPYTLAEVFDQIRSVQRENEQLRIRVEERQGTVASLTDKLSVAGDSEMRLKKALDAEVARNGKQEALHAAEIRALKDKLRSTKSEQAQLAEAMDANKKAIDHAKAAADRRVAALQSALAVLEKERDQLRADSHQLKLAGAAKQGETVETAVDRAVAREKQRPDVVQMAKDLAAERARNQELISKNGSLQRQQERKEEELRSAADPALLVKAAAEVSSIVSNGALQLHSRGLSLHRLVVALVTACRNDYNIAVSVDDPVATFTSAKSFFEAFERADPILFARSELANAAGDASTAVHNVLGSDCLMLSQLIHALKDNKRGTTGRRKLHGGGGARAVADGSAGTTWDDMRPATTDAREGRAKDRYVPNWVLAPEADDDRASPAALDNGVRRSPSRSASPGGDRPASQMSMRPSTPPYFDPPRTAPGHATKEAVAQPSPAAVKASADQPLSVSQMLSGSSAPPTLPAPRRAESALGAAGGICGVVVGGQSLLPKHAATPLALLRTAESAAELSNSPPGTPDAYIRIGVPPRPSGVGGRQSAMEPAQMPADIPRASTPFSSFLQGRKPLSKDGAAALPPLSEVEGWNRGSHTQTIAEALTSAPFRPSTTIPSSSKPMIDISSGISSTASPPMLEGLPRRVGTPMGPLAPKQRRLVWERARTPSAGLRR